MRCPNGRQVTPSGDVEAMAGFMNDAFDEHDDVDKLLVFEQFEGAKLSDAKLMKAQRQSLENVGRYAVSVRLRQPEF